MKITRRHIRNILLEIMEIEQANTAEELRRLKKLETLSQNKELKRFFQKNADQDSLQQLRYIHWGTAAEIENLLGASGKSEISALIHHRKGRIIPWAMDPDGTYGLQLKGYVTFAANIDLDSGRPGGDGFSVPKANQSSGLPKRPSKKSLQLRTADAYYAAENYGENWLAKYAHNRPHFSGEDRQNITDPDLARKEALLYRVMRGDGGAADRKSRRGKEFRSIEDVLILSAKDFISVRPSVEKTSHMEYPEAIIDNWSPVKVYVPKKDLQDIRRTGGRPKKGSITSLAMAARKSGIRLVEYE